MIGREHYREAERLIDVFAENDQRQALLVAEAQVHATLAQVEVGRAIEKQLAELANSLDKIERSMDTPFSDVASAIRQAGDRS